MMQLIQLQTHILINYLNEMNSSGIEFCFMEVSSHGIDQNRIKGLVFSGGIFTTFHTII